VGSPVSLGGESIGFNELAFSGVPRRARALARSVRLYLHRAAKGRRHLESKRGRVVVSRAPRGIIHPTKVAALRQEQGPTLTTYSGRRARARYARGSSGGRGGSSRARASFSLVSSLPLSLPSLFPLLLLRLLRATSSSASLLSPMIRSARGDVSPPATIFLSRALLPSSLRHVPSNLRLSFSFIRAGRVKRAACAAIELGNPAPSKAPKTRWTVY